MREAEELGYPMRIDEVVGVDDRDDGSSLHAYADPSDRPDRLLA